MIVRPKAIFDIDREDFHHPFASLKSWQPYDDLVDAVATKVQNLYERLQKAWQAKSVY